MALATTVVGDLHYEGFGPPGGETVLLLGGTGRQAIDYDDVFCDALTSRGYHAIRLDTRDTGPSAGLGDTPSNLEAVYRAARLGEPADAAYGLADLAEDAVAVLDAAGVERAHLVGRSLGSSVAQTLALLFPAQVLSLTLVMANSRSVASDIAETTIARIAAESPGSEDDFVARQVCAAQVGALPQDFAAERVSAEARAMWQRGVHPGGIARHFAAGLGMADLRPALGGVSIPTLVIHGAHDRTIAPNYARETAEAIAGARLELLDDMGHDGSPRVRARWLPLILEHLGGVGGGAGT